MMTCMFTGRRDRIARSMAEPMPRIAALDGRAHAPDRGAFTARMLQSTLRHPVTQPGRIHAHRIVDAVVLAAALPQGRPGEHVACTACMPALE